MPDDRELLDTNSSTRMLGNRIPGTAATDEAILDMQQHEPVDPNVEPLKKRPFGFLFWFAIGFVTVVVFSPVLANLLPLQNPNFGNYSALNQAPSGSHLLGTDDLGRDLLSRLVFGARVSLIVGFLGVTIGLVFGGTAGLISGYRGGRIDIALNAGSFIILAFPAIVAVIAIVTFWGASLFHITFILITVAGLIVIEGTLAFLGLSVALPTPSWGNLINEGTANNSLSSDPYIMLWPALAMFLLLWSITLIGDRLRQRFDIREGLL